MRRLSVRIWIWAKEKCSELVMGHPAKMMLEITCGFESLFFRNMLSYHNLELKYRFGYYLLSVLLGGLVVFEYKYIVLFHLCPIELIFTELYEGFSCLLWLSLCVSLIVSLPYLGYSCVSFFGPGLYKHERKRLLRFMFQQGLLFLMILCSYIKYLLPFGLFFFISFMNENLVCSIKLVDFTMFVTNIVFLALGTTGVLLLGLSLPLVQLRKWVYSGLLLIIAIVTPPDIVSLLLVWFPLMLMLELGYYIGIVLKISKVG